MGPTGSTATTMPNMKAVKVKPQGDGRKYLGHVITAIVTFTATLAAAMILHTGTPGRTGAVRACWTAPSSRPRPRRACALTSARTLPRATSACSSRAAGGRQRGVLQEGHLHRLAHPQAVMPDTHGWLACYLVTAAVIILLNLGWWDYRRHRHRSGTQDTRRSTGSPAPPEARARCLCTARVRMDRSASSYR